MSYLQLLKLVKKEKEEKRKGQVLEEAEFVESAEEADLRKKLVPPSWEQREPSRYAHPFPDFIWGLGPRHVVRFSPCANCGTGTWAAFGPWRLCLRCSNLRRSVHGDACGCPTCRPVHGKACDCLTCMPE